MSYDRGDFVRGVLSRDILSASRTATSGVARIWCEEGHEMDRDAEGDEGARNVGYLPPELTRESDGAS